MNKTALITGAGRGIGRACAVRFAAEGYHIIGVSRTASDLAETAALCPGPFTSLPGDVTDEATVARAVAAAPQIDALIHCAGVAPLLPLEETTPAIFREVLDTNLTSAFLFARAAWPKLKLASGRIVMISSMAARDPFPGFSAYAAAKAGLNGLVTALDREGKPLGIRAYGVAPGAVETAMFRKLLTPAQYPPENALTPEQVADTVFQCVCGALVYSGGETLYMSKL